MARIVTWTAALAAVLVLAACGGGTPVPGATSGGGATPAPGATTTGGGGVGDPCALLTADEAAGALGTDPLSTTTVTGDPAKCSYALASGEEALTVDVLENGAAAQYQSFVDNGSGEDVAGVGDKALFERSSRRLVFTSGALFVSVFPRYAGGADAALAASTAIGKIIAARLSGGTVPPDAQITAPPVITAGAACDLLTPEEVESVLGKGPMEEQGNEGLPQFCTYATTSGEVLVSTYLQARGGAGAWSGLEGSLTTDPVSGLGDKAMFEPSTGILFVLKGDSILNVNVFGVDPAAALEPDRGLAELMLEHL